MLLMSIYRNKPAGKNMLTSDEKGNVLIYTLLLLVLLTIIGISAAQIATVDIQVSGNHMIHKKNFYKAEGAAMDAIQRMEGIDLNGASLSWVSNSTADPDVFVSQTRIDSYWADGANFIGPAQAMKSDIDNEHAKFVVFSEGVIHTGESLDMTKSKIYQYKVFGRCEEYRGKSVIEVGYRKVN